MGVRDIWLNGQQAAAYCGRSDEWLRKKVNAGKIRFSLDPLREIIKVSIVMNKGKLIAGCILAIIALIYLSAIIFAGSNHQFFFFLTFAGLAFALIDEALTEKAKR